MEPALDSRILPTPFGEGYGLYKTKRGISVFSFVFHIVAAALLVASGRFVVEHRQQIRQQVVAIATEVAPYILPASSSTAGEAGGGDRDKLAASKGTLPRFSREQLTPPSAVVRNENTSCRRSRP